MDFLLGSWWLSVLFVVWSIFTHPVPCPSDAGCLIPERRDNSDHLVSRLTTLFTTFTRVFCVQSQLGFPRLANVFSLAAHFRHTIPFVEATGCFLGVTHRTFNPPGLVSLALRDGTPTLGLGFFVAPLESLFFGFTTFFRS